MLQYSTNATPVDVSTPLQISWSNEARLETSSFTLQATNLSRPIVSHTLHFVHNTTGSNTARPTISIADKFKHLVVLTTPSQTAHIPLNLLSAATVAHYVSRPTKTALRIQRRQESESLFLAPSTTARRGRLETTEATHMNSEASAVLTMDAPTTDTTRGPRPRTSTDTASTSSSFEDSSVSAQPSHVSFEQEVGYTIHTGREMSEEMIPYGLIAVVTVLGCGCLVSILLCCREVYLTFTLGRCILSFQSASLAKGVSAGTARIRWKAGTVLVPRRSIVR